MNQFLSTLFFVLLAMMGAPNSNAQNNSVNGKQDEHKAGEITDRSTPADFEISPGDAAHHQMGLDAINKFLYLYRLPGSGEDLEKARVKAWQNAMHYIAMPPGDCSEMEYPNLVNVEVPCDEKFVPPPFPPNNVKMPYEKSKAATDTVGGT